MAGWMFLKMRYTLLRLILKHGFQLLDPVPGFHKGEPQLAQLGHAGAQHLLFAGFRAIDLPVTGLCKCLTAALTGDCHAWSLDHIPSKMRYTLFSV